MPSLDARGVASLLREYAQRTALRGGNPYRAKAYSRAADSLAALAVPLDVLVEEDRLTGIPDIGDAIADIVTKLHKTGSHPSLEKLRQEIPAGVLEMLAVTRQRGFEYFGVADHSKSAHYAGGLSVEEIAQQHLEADRLNKRFGKDLRILKGIESDILADGSLDYPDDVLERFDFVVASIHGRFKLDRKAQTQRLLRAISNPYTTIVGHMTGRQLQRRPGYEIDIEKVLRACAKHDIVVEINAHPWRLDLDWRWHQAAWSSAAC
ncbi:MULTISPECIES: DNA polymerase/3'-5' exonuclease PolX [Bradyrhizobium]|uniref:DNA polymerase/3'-5' exonuclease PolX n=1 Tax=Bradyrhizobium TaxID=374 RepID=UPI0004BCAB60|nr:MULTISPECIES: DNA polymerase/3'-5' exonuclease PolX [unclassified Bradyrhizobium]